MNSSAFVQWASSLLAALGSACCVAVLYHDLKHLWRSRNHKEQIRNEPSD